MTQRAGILALALLTASACSNPAPPPPPPARAIPQLSATDRPGNAERIAAFFRQHCVERIVSKAAFEEGLRASGWSAREDRITRNRPDRDRIAGYDLAGGHLTILWAADGNGSCTLTVETELAAPFEPLRDALSRFGGRPTPGTEPGIANWRWDGAPGQDFSMMLIADEEANRRNIRLTLRL